MYMNTVNQKLQNYIAYYRVSTEKQGKSGLGLEAQKEAVANYLQSLPNQTNLLADFVEVESGKKNNRPQLQEALDQAKKEKATLLIAKLDRLGRNVAFIANLMDSKVKFVAVDNPNANDLMLHIMAAFAQYEREQISVRIVEALKQAKERGVILGKYGREVLSKRNKERADEFSLGLVEVIQKIKDEGITTIRGIKDELNYRQVKTYREGGKWHNATVLGVLRRIEALA